MYTTVQQVRQRAGFQNYQVDKALKTTGSSAVWNVNAKDLEKFVPVNSNGATVGTASDVTVKFNGLSFGFSSIDTVSGDITFAAGTTAGASLTATFASSPVKGVVIYGSMLEANAIVNSYLSKKYSLPLGVCVPMLNDLESKIAAGNLLINSYGVSGQDSAEDGFRMVEEATNMLERIVKGEIELVDISENIVSQDAGNIAGGSNALGGTGVRVKGYLFTADQEKFDVVDATTYRNSN